MVHLIFVDCRCFSALLHRSFFLLGLVGYNLKLCAGYFEKIVEDELASRNLEDDSIGYLVEAWSTLKESNCLIFEVKARSCKDFKLYFMRILCNWSQVLDCHIN